MKFRNLIFTVYLAGAIVMSAGCRGTNITTVQVRQDIDFSFIKKVAVLPLENFTAEKSAGDAIRQMVIHEMLASGFVDVSMPGDVMTAIEKTGIRNGHVSNLNAEQIKAVGSALKVQAVVFGSIERFGDTKSGNYTVPELTVTLMMADANSGSILWSVTKTSVGDSFLARHFGARSPTMSEIMVQVVRDAIRTLAKQ